MTQLNQQISAVTREVVETGEPVEVTNRGQVVLRLMPAVPASEGPLTGLVSKGLATPPRRRHDPGRSRGRVELSRDLDDLLDEVNADADL